MDRKTVVNEIRINITRAISLAFILSISLFVLQEKVFAQQLPQPAQEPNTIQSNTQDTSTVPYQIEISVGTQSPWTKKVPLTVKARPSVDTTRTNITWDFPIGVEITDKNSGKYVAVKAGEVYSTDISIKPVVSGTYTIAATATDWGYGANFASTTSVNITFNDKLVVTPADPSYASAVIIMYVILVLVGIIAAFVIFILVKLGIKKLKNFLKPPEL